MDDLKTADLNDSVVLAQLTQVLRDFDACEDLTALGRKVEAHFGAQVFDRCAEALPQLQTELHRAQRVDRLLNDVFADASARWAALLWLCPSLKGVDAHPDAMTLLTRLQKLDGLRDRLAPSQKSDQAMSTELLRRMLLGIADDVRVVVVFLATRLDELRDISKGSKPIVVALCLETRDILIPLANRLGLGYFKWELEDLVFRFLDPKAYKELALAIDEKRIAREGFIKEVVDTLERALLTKGLPAEVYGRPKHLFSVAEKIRLKRLSIDHIHDLRALRVIVQTVEQCYLALDVVNSLWRSKDTEFDDYIARPKANGYQSIHCVVEADDGRSLEVQIRTVDMHRFAEFGVASHWRYKERGGTPPANGSSAAGRSSHEAQLHWMRQLLQWQQELKNSLDAQRPTMPSKVQERVYVLTPQARVIELPMGATPLDFAYHLHSGLGHRCRGAKVNGQLVPLHRSLKHADTVEILLAPKSQFEAGPSRDWLGNDPIYLVSARAKAKVRQWFASRESEVEAVAPHEPTGKPAIKDDRKEEGGDFSNDFDRVQGKPTTLITHSALGTKLNPEILVVGVDALLTRLARCCRPLPPDAITGYVSLGKGVTVHRSQCASLTRLAANKSERLIATSWGQWELHRHDRHYPVDVMLLARDRPSLLRDINEALAKGKWTLLAMKTLSRKDSLSIRCTLELASVNSLREALAQLAQVAGIETARRMADFGRKAGQTASSVSI
jgi:GTP pyrophosphokinase